MSDKFCRHCGNPLPPERSSARLPVTTLAPWLTLGAILMVGLGFAIGSSGIGAARESIAAVPASGDGAIILAPDISTLSPEERVDRLFNRVMALAAAGKDDSVQFFAPMAINAMAALLPLDAHRRYDLGLIQLTAGDAAAARAQADSILAEQPRHLLGLALAMRAALAEGRAADARRAAESITRVAAAERATGALEYTEHARDVAAALEEAQRLRAQSPPTR